MTTNLIEEYSEKIEPLLELAKRAYGSRSTTSPQHDASREYTALLVEYYGKGGSLLDLASKLKVTYAGMRRRIITAELSSTKKRTRSKATIVDVSTAAEMLKALQQTGHTEEYHNAVYKVYEEEGISLGKLAKAMGLSSSNPLYYAVAKARIAKSELV
jgi:hypothetical protein